MYPIEKYNYVKYDQKNKDGTVSKVILAMSTYCGKLVKGVAKCIATDTFDENKGMTLAAARCDEKVCFKRRTRAFKKYEEAKKLYHEAEKHLCAMADYYYESVNEHMDSLIRLSEIETDLR